jgi:hypothetical protein
MIVQILFMNIKSGNYTLGFIDLHWATTEHAVEDKKLNMEAQLHHFNPWFDTYEDAVEHQGQTLAIAILFRVLLSVLSFQSFCVI